MIKARLCISEGAHVDPGPTGTQVLQIWICFAEVVQSISTCAQSYDKTLIHVHVMLIGSGSSKVAIQLFLAGTSSCFLDSYSDAHLYLEYIYPPMSVS